MRQTTPLHFCAMNNRHESLALLLRLGADVNIRDHRGNTPLMRAVERGHVRCVRHLCDAQLLHEGAQRARRSVNASSSLPDLFARNINLESALFVGELSSSFTIHQYVSLSVVTRDHSPFVKEMFHYVMGFLDFWNSCIEGASRVHAGVVAVSAAFG